MSVAAALAHAAALERSAMQALVRHRDSVALVPRAARAYGAAFPTARIAGRTVLEADHSPLALGALCAVAGGARLAVSVAGTRTARAAATAAVEANYGAGPGAPAAVFGSVPLALAGCRAAGVAAPTVVVGALCDVAALRPWAWHTLLAARDAVTRDADPGPGPVAQGPAAHAPFVLPGTVTVWAALATLPDTEERCHAAARGERRAAAEAEAQPLGAAPAADFAGLADLGRSLVAGDRALVAGRAWADDVPRAALHRIRPARALFAIAALPAPAPGEPAVLSLPLPFPPRPAAECGATALVVWATAVANGVSFSSEPPLRGAPSPGPLAAAPAVMPQTVLFFPRGMAPAIAGGELDIILPLDPCADAPCFALKDRQGDVVCAYT